MGGVGADRQKEIGKGSRRSGNWAPATGNWPPITGHWELATGNWEPYARGGCCVMQGVEKCFWSCGGGGLVLSL